MGVGEYSVMGCLDGHAPTVSQSRDCRRGALALDCRMRWALPSLVKLTLFPPPEDTR